jgi:ubiquinone/menaquinone biosynthesis C-methylase UbiE
MTYVLGHSDRELARLSAQARLVDPITRRFFLEAGIGAGMRVLDVGSGAGDVTFLAAELVGESGEVVGVDRSAAALEVACARAAERSLANVSFLEGDPASMPFERPFDAAVGRYVLQFQADPAAMLRKVAEHVRPDGVVVFHELDWDGSRSFPPVPTYDNCCRLCRETIRSAAETQMGGKLFPTFLAAGLNAPTLRLEALVGVTEPLRSVANLTGSLAAKIEQLGLARATELDPDTLFERMLDEAQASNSFVVGNFQFGAWSRV